MAFTLKYFNEQVLAARDIRAEFASFRGPYPHVMVIDGNDPRGIDVGLMSRFPIASIRSHIDDVIDLGDDASPVDERIFSRDCPECLIELGTGADQRLLVMPNHFKSKRSSSRADLAASHDKRHSQALRASEIAREALTTCPLVLIGGDLNDTPDSTALAPLWADGFVDVQEHESYPRDRPGTYGTGTQRDKIDYLIQSPELHSRLVATGIERRGTWAPRTWESFPTVDGRKNEASDHHLVWGDFEIGT